MINIVKKIVKRIGKEEIIYPIYDGYKYSRNLSSYAGNSLCGKNILIITNASEKAFLKFQSILENEKCNFNVIYTSRYEKDIDVDDILCSADDFVGPLTHIINFMYVGNSSANSIFHELEEPVGYVYRLLQKEISFLIMENLSVASICTAVHIEENDFFSGTTCAGIRSLIEGLGGVAATHGIINNGVISTEDIPMEKVWQTSMYLCSKYGQILAGEVLQMGE